MRKILLAAVAAAGLAMGATGLALAQDNDQDGDHNRHGLFRSDANSDGVLTRQEFDAGRNAMFARLDADNNGQVTSEERRAHHGERGHHGGRGHRGGGMHHLTRADANNDGNITRDEFLARPIEHFDRLDANDDGIISATERPQRAERRERRNPDANGDGSLSRDEFATMGASLFGRLDANNDGRVTQEEAQAGRRHHRGHD